METSPILQALERIEADAYSGQSLLLYALIKTLEIKQQGHLYLLSKLKEMNPDTRQIAYGLMEMMAQGKTGNEEWTAAVSRMDTAIRR